MFKIMYSVYNGYGLIHAILNNDNSNSDVSDSINSIFTWDLNVAVCLAYPADVDLKDDLDRLNRRECFYQ
ncbi:hypothetical protein M433DRAFT_150183 [Acidomyces richmondensis BFW]|nr:MAG: hypothetical protein FE78DRAFT_94401 [Acidomyces sp. 'richmondensis']KYG49230.1 hypothetical protein M433DRAFT_150183 [Acidomyces richmondensis BFW]